jgi:hypothetical protein
MTSELNPEAIFLDHLDFIDRIAATIGRKDGLWEDEIEELLSWIKLRLIEENYAVFRNYRGDSTNQTGIATIVARMFSVYTHERRARWRPSAAAVQAGLTAVELEMLVRRDGYSLAQAGELLRTSRATSLSDLQLAGLLASLQQGISASEGAVIETKEPQDFDRPGILGPDGLPIREEDLQGSPIITDIISTNEKLLRMVRDDPATMYNLSPRQFEELVAELLDKQGYEIELTPPSKDGGFDMYAARKDGLGEFLYLVECKRYAPVYPVGVGVVRALYGVVQKMKATAGIVVTTAQFTRGAKEFQQSVSYQIALRDYLHLQQWLKQR